MAYKKGYSFERDLKLQLQDQGWKVIRSGGSKKPDMIAAKEGKIIVIECKVTKNSTVYLAKDEVQKLQEVAEHFKGECVFYIKQNGSKDYTMASLDQLKEVDNSFVLKLN